MANPVMTRIEDQIKELDGRGRTPAGYPAMPGYEAGAPGVDLQAARAAQAAHTADVASSPYTTGPISRELPMSVDDVIVRTGFLFALVVLAAAGTWMLGMRTPEMMYPALIAGSIGGLVLAMVNIFKSVASPALISAYAIAEGIALGAISLFFNTMYPGIVVQAVLATFAVFAITLVAFRSGKVRATPKMNKFLLIGLLGLIGFGLISLIASWTGLSQGSLYDITIMGIPLGIAIGIFAVVLGALSLIQDFTIAEAAARAGAPKIFAWRCAFGLIVTLVWLYLEILRLLSYVNRD